MKVETQEWTALFEADALDDDEATRVEINEKRIAVYKTGGKYFASDDRCPHGNASLSEGWLEDGVIECPLHQSLFDLQTGQVLSPPCKVDVRVYEIKVEDNTVYIKTDT